MVLLVKHKYLVYRKYKKDIWGRVYTDVSLLNLMHDTKRRKFMRWFWFDAKAKNIDNDLETEKFYIACLKNTLFKFFFKLFLFKRQIGKQKYRRYVFRLDWIILKWPKEKWNKRFVSIRITRLFFINLKDHHFRKLFKAATKLSGQLETNYCYFIEGRLLFFVYRTNLVSNLFELAHYIKMGNISIEFKQITSINVLVPIGTFVFFDENYYLKKLKNNLLKRILLERLVFNKPRYMYINYVFNFAIMLRKPKKNDLIYPIAIDIQRLSGFF